MINVVLIGSGNVATHLFDAFNNAEDVMIKQWYSRDLKNIENSNNQILKTNNLNNLIKADVYIIAVSDNAISSISSKLPFKNRLVAHTSGAIGLPDMDHKNHRGVFYPLQTFTKGALVDFLEVPICIEIEKKPDFLILKTLAEAIGSPFYKVNSQQRAALHLAAVFTNNFSNQLYRIAHEITEANAIDFDVLKPLIKETARKIETLSPFMAQTGPAKRNDTKTIQKHLNALTNTDHKTIYELMTKSIQQTHGKKL